MRAGRGGRGPGPGLGPGLVIMSIVVVVLILIVLEGSFPSVTAVLISLFSLLLLFIPDILCNLFQSRNEFASTMLRDLQGMNDLENSVDTIMQTDRVGFAKGALEVDLEPGREAGGTKGVETRGEIDSTLVMT